MERILTIFKNPLFSFFSLFAFLFKVDEPTLTHHNHSKSIIYLKVTLSVVDCADLYVSIIIISHTVF